MLYFDGVFLAPEVQKFVVLGVCILRAVYREQFDENFCEIFALTSFFFQTGSAESRRTAHSLSRAV